MALAAGVGRWWRALALLPVLALLAPMAGCSLLEFGYRQLDWIVLQRVEQLVYLEPEQRKRLAQDIDLLIDWHCRTELPRYADLLGDLGQDFRQGEMTAGLVARYAEAFEARWYALLTESTKPAARLLAGLSERQRAEFIAALAERNREMAEEATAATGSDPSRGYARTAERQLRRWFGPLDAQQRAIIAAWSREFEPLGQLGVDYRRDLHERLRRLLQQQAGKPDGMQDALLALVAEIRRAPPSAYAARVDANKQRSLDMVTRVARAASPKQLRHAGGFVARLRREIDGIDCP